MNPIANALGTIAVALALLGAPAMWWADRHTLEFHLHWTVPVIGKSIGFDLRPFGESLGDRLADLKAADAKAIVQVRTVTVTQTRIVHDAGQAEAAAQAQIRDQAAELQKEIPLALPPSTDRAYPLPVGLVRVFDASILGLPLSAVPDDAGRADDAPSPVTDSEAASVFADNNKECLVDRERLVRLQDTWTALAAAANAPAKTPPTADR